MANVEHANLTGSQLHEPKGLDAVGEAGRVYVSDGLGSGDWTKAHAHINGYIPFDAVTPAYQHSVTTSFTPINPTFSITLDDEFSGTSSPNARLIYTGIPDVTGFCTLSFNFKNSSGSNRDLEVIFYKNGSVMNGGHIIVTAVAGEWKSAVLSDATSLSTNDYIEVFVKADSAFNLDVASASLIVHGVPG